VARVHHLVVLQFKPGTTDATIAALYAALARLKQTIAGLETFHGGPYASPEGLNQGFTHGFAMTFTDAAARNAYLVHPDHERVKEQFLPVVAYIVAFDFEE
jgi:hypothetical protein